MFRLFQHHPKVTNESYFQWLRAGRPPFDWFFGLSQLEREQLALLGDEYLDFASATGSEAPADDTSQARQFAADLAEKIVNKRQSPSRPVSMAGTGRRQNEQQAERNRKLFGRDSET